MNHDDALEAVYRPECRPLQPTMVLWRPTQMSAKEKTSYTCHSVELPLLSLSSLSLFYTHHCWLQRMQSFTNVLAVLLALAISTCHAAPASIRQAYRSLLNDIDTSRPTPPLQATPVNHNEVELPSRILNEEPLTAAYPEKRISTNQQDSTSYHSSSYSPSSPLSSYSTSTSSLSSVPPPHKPKNKMKANETLEEYSKRKRLANERMKRKREFCGVAGQGRLPHHAKYNSLCALQMGLLSRQKERVANIGSSSSSSHHYESIQKAWSLKSAKNKAKIYVDRNLAKAKLLGFNKTIPLPEKCKDITVEVMEAQIFEAGGVRSFIGEDDYDAWYRKVKFHNNKLSASSMRKRRCTSRR